LIETSILYTAYCNHTNNIGFFRLGPDKFE